MEKLPKATEKTREAKEQEGTLENGNVPQEALSHSEVQCGTAPHSTTQQSSGLWLSDTDFDALGGEKVINYDTANRYFFAVFFFLGSHA
jgi:hypothetical protein